MPTYGTATLLVVTVFKDLGGTKEKFIVLLVSRKPVESHETLMGIIIINIRL